VSPYSQFKFILNCPSFVSLLHEISGSPPQRSRLHNRSRIAYPALQTFSLWVSELRTRFTPLPANTSIIVFRLLFPDQDSRRKYDLKETKLARNIADCLGVSLDGRGESLRLWNSEYHSGCLGEEVKRLMDEIYVVRNHLLLGLFS